MIHPSFFDFPQWPPMPHPLTQLRLSEQESWGIKEWRLYAQILEAGGEFLFEVLTNTQEELRNAREKASRPKKQPAPTPPLELAPGQSLLSRATLYASEPARQSASQKSYEKPTVEHPITIFFNGRPFVFTSASSANYQPKPKPGRPRGSNYEEIARMIIAKRNEMEANRIEKVTDQQAYEQIFLDNGNSEWRSRSLAEKDWGSIANNISKIRKKEGALKKSSHKK